MGKCLLLVGLLVACACPWNDDLREFLNSHFWLPFAKQSASFERPNVRRMNAPFAGMTIVCAPANRAPDPISDAELTSASNELGSLLYAVASWAEPFAAPK